MKKILVTALISLFTFNQVSLAFDGRGEIGRSMLLDKFVKAKIEAQVASMSDSEKTKLIDGINEDLEKADSALLKISEDKFEMLKSNALAKIDNEIKNSNEVSLTLVDSLKFEEKQELSKDLSEEELLLSSSLDEALKQNIATSIKTNLLLNKMQIKTMKFENLKNSVKSLKEKMKNPANVPQWGMILCIAILAIGTLTVFIGGIGFCAGLFSAGIGLGMFFGGLGVDLLGMMAMVAW